MLLFHFLFHVKTVLQSYALMRVYVRASLYLLRTSKLMASH